MWFSLLYKLYYIAHATQEIYISIEIIANDHNTHTH